MTTHLVDLIQWSCFPEQIIDYETDVIMNSASRWPTPLTHSQFESITGVGVFPEYLSGHLINDTVLEVFANGEMNYSLKGVHSRVIVKWGYRAPEGGGDTHYSMTRGTNATLIIEQGEKQGFKPALYIKPSIQADYEGFGDILMQEFKKVQERYPGVELKKLEDSWEVVVPEVYDVGHEAHFAQVTNKYLGFLVDGKLPAWEVPNMIAKYFTTTRALEMARESE